MPTPSDRSIEALAREIEESLKATSPGHVVASSRLWRELGFVSLSAMRRAVASGRLSLPVFEMEGRRGLFARRAVLARYLAEQEVRGRR